MQVEDGGVATVDGQALVDEAASATGILVQGTGSSLSVTGALVLAQTSNGSLVVDEGGEAFAKSALIGNGDAGSQGQVQVDGSGSLLEAPSMTVGGATPTATNGAGQPDGTDGDWTYSGGSGSLTISDGGSVSVGGMLTLHASGERGARKSESTSSPAGTSKLGVTAARPPIRCRSSPTASLSVTVSSIQPSPAGRLWAQRASPSPSIR